MTKKTTKTTKKKRRLKKPPSSRSSNSCNTSSDTQETITKDEFSSIPPSPNDIMPIIEECLIFDEDYNQDDYLIREWEELES